MNKQTAQLLEKHFDTAFAAPDCVAKLRELILTLAMQGKLVAQNPNDPPAAELLKEIEAEKQRLVKAGKIKPPKPLPPIKAEEEPYALPQGWAWVRLIEIGSWALGSGLAHSIQGDTGQEILLCKVSDMNLLGNEKFIVTANNTVSEKVVQQNKLNISDPGTIIFPKIGGAIATNKRRILQKKTVIDNNCLGIAPATAMDLEWCYQLLLSFDFAKYQTGTSVPAISQGIIGEIVIGLPPASEQHRIVARIDQLMTRCDALEKLREEREEKRLAVHAAAIKQLLDAPDGTAWEFIQQHFGELYTVKENVAELRKAILQLAVMGRLVPQNPNDPPASELLKEIEAEKQRLAKAGKIKPPKPLTPIKPEEAPYELPQGWAWVRFFDPNTVKSELVSARDCPDDNQIAPDSIEKDTGRLLFHRTVAESGATGPNNRFYEGQILYSKIRPSLNKVVIAPYDGLCSADMYPIICHADAEFMLKAILSEPFLAQVRLAENRVKMPKLNLESLGQFVIPLPPLPEQHRIVARIDQLMALCDTLDQQIDAATCKQTELINAVMAQV